MKSTANFNPECPMQGEIKMTKMYLLKKVIEHFYDRWSEESQELIAGKLLDSLLKDFEIKTIAQMITTFPNAGYNVKYDSESSKKFIEELHQKRVEANEEQITKLLENGKNSRSTRNLFQSL